MIKLSINRSIWIACLTVLLLNGCGKRNNITETQREVARAIVAGMTIDAIQLSAFENIYANELRTEADVVCLVATGLPDLSQGITSATLQIAAASANADTIIINTMVGVDARDRSAGNLDEYIQAITPLQRVPGNEGLVESRVFDAKSGELLWSNWSRPVNPRGRLQDLAREAQRLADDLADDEVIKPVVVEAL